MHRVLEHIDRHRLELEPLARVANFSSFYFHRVLAAWMGDNVGEYLRRRRLEVGALLLAAQPTGSGAAVGVVGRLRLGRSVAHAFKARFGETPTAWRFHRISAGPVPT